MKKIAISFAKIRNLTEKHARNSYSIIDRYFLLCLLFMRFLVGRSAFLIFMAIGVQLSKFNIGATQSESSKWQLRPNKYFPNLLETRLKHLALSSTYFCLAKLGDPEKQIYHRLNFEMKIVQSQSHETSTMSCNKWWSDPLILHTPTDLIYSP